MNLVIKEQVLGFRQPISLEGYPKCTVLKCGPPPYLPAGLEQKVVRRIFRRSACRQHVPGVRIPPLYHHYCHALSLLLPLLLPLHALQMNSHSVAPPRTPLPSRRPFSPPGQYTKYRERTLVSFPGCCSRVRPPVFFAWQGVCVWVEPGGEDGGHRGLSRDGRARVRR